MLSAHRAADEQDISEPGQADLLSRYRYHKGGHIHYKGLYKKHRARNVRLALVLIVLACVNIGLLVDIFYLNLSISELGQELTLLESLL